MLLLIRILLRWVILAVIIGVVAEIVPGMDVSRGFGSLLWIALLFSVVNLIVGPILRLFGLPLVILTLGLFLLVINAALIAITAGLSSDLAVDNFWTALLAGFLISVFSEIAEFVLPLHTLAE